MLKLRIATGLSGLLGAVLLLGQVPSLAQTAQTLNTKALAATCANCHGTNGNAVPGEAMVRLAGLPKEHIVTQLQAFRDGKRPATVMHQLTKGYTNAQIEAIAAYFSSIK
jgi:cytochrome subunit of sulfide dehydrogenase